MKLFACMYFLFLVLAFSGTPAYTQESKEDALKKAKEAIELMDAGRIDESIILLKKAQKLDPESHQYPYEIGYAYYLKKEYKKAAKMFLQASNCHDVTDQCFQMLGNVYDMMGDTASAIKHFNNGLRIFPNSGRIYLEKGNIYWTRQAYLKALIYYEKGIVADPTFSSNYYRASKIYCSSTEKTWGLIYGEIFLNLERNSTRSLEISELLYKTYKKTIGQNRSNDPADLPIHANTQADQSFIKSFILYTAKSIPANFLKEKEMSISSINSIRTAFINSWYKMGEETNYPNFLFNLQRTLALDDNFEAYNYWIFKEGNSAEFTSWTAHNPGKWSKFIKWFTNNQLEIKGVVRRE